MRENHDHGGHGGLKPRPRRSEFIQVDGLQYKMLQQRSKKNKYKKIIHSKDFRDF